MDIFAELPLGCFFYATFGSYCKQVSWNDLILS
jgi:hypothetical protein